MRTKWIYTMFVLALSLFASCSDTIDEAGADGKTRKVVFRLSVSDANVGSRAPWSGTYDSSDAEGIENYINPNTLQVVVYEGTTYRGKATGVLTWPVTNGENEYQFVGDLSHLNLVSDNAYQFMVFANCAEVVGTTQLSRLPYDISDLKNAIPMWGVKKVTLNNDELQDIGTIDLLRAAAKIEVDLKVEKNGNLEDTSPMKDYTLESVSIKPYNTRGYCAPSGVNFNVDGTKDLDQEGCFNPHATLAEGSSGHSSLPFTVSQDGKRAIVYVPEYDNKHTGSHPATISVTLKKGSDTYLYEDAIVFYKYDSNGSPLASVENEYNIIRNHHYKFTVTGVSGGLLIKYAVNDWVYEENTHKTDLETYGYPTYHNPLESVKEVNSPKYTPVLWYSADGSGDFLGYFYFESPTDKKWTPTFKNASRTDYTIEVWDGFGTTKLYDSDISTSMNNEGWNEREDYSGWYLIKVKAKGVECKDDVNLGITTTLGIGTTPYYLLINGTEATDIRWMNSGTDPRFIEIKIIGEKPATFVMDDDADTANSFTTDAPIMKTAKENEKFTDTHAFTACFQLTNIEDYHYWCPTISDAQNYAVRVYDGESLIYSTYKEDGKNGFDCLKLLKADNNKWYTIKVFPLCDTPAASIIKLGINHERGNNQPKALEINGSASNIKWPNSGSDPEFIEITHESNQ